MVTKFEEILILRMYSNIRFHKLIAFSKIYDRYLISSLYSIGLATMDVGR